MAGAAAAQSPAADFKQNCSSCHTIGGGTLTGPDLKDVSQRKDRAWLVKFVTDPAGVLASGDPYAAKLLQAARGVPMPPIAGMTKTRANDLLDLIEAESKLEKSQFAGVQLPDRPLTDADVALGREVFLGLTRLKNGGTSCVSCHAIGGVGWLGGGTLGPDLTKVFEKYEDRRKLGAWLSAPATETMLPTFKAHPLEADEILGLVAFLKDAAARHEEDDAPRALIFILLGLGGALGALVGFNRAWSGRFRAVRRPLVHRTKGETA
ncbi:MAG: c-type cytochrome [Planctomycetota bacterium]